MNLIDVVTTSLILGFALAALVIKIMNVALAQRIDKVNQRGALLDQVQREINFMKPISDRLRVEIREAVEAKDWPRYEKLRRSYNVMAHRWEREVSNKIGS